MEYIFEGPMRVLRRLHVIFNTHQLSSKRRYAKGGGCCDEVHDMPDGGTEADRRV